LSTKDLKKVPEIRVFNKWPTGGIEAVDLGLKRYIALRPSLVPHTNGRHEHQRFRKSTINLAERLIDDMMRPGRSGGDKAKAIGIVKNALDLVAIRTGKNPLEILVKAVENAAPCEDVTRIAYGGIVYPISVDIAPQRRVDISLRHITEAARAASHNNPKSVDESLADELVLAAARDPKSASVRKRDEIERVALASR
jgi:small subunit ribosomal protein S7